METILEYNNKKVLILAPSKTLLQRKLGKIIDIYDIVCRINSSGLPKLITKYKETIGTKKDIWFLGHIGLIHKNKHTYKNIVIANEDYYNEWFFTMLNYILSEQLNIDWLTKSTIIQLRKYSNVYERPKTYKSDNVNDIIDYLKFYFC